MVGGGFWWFGKCRQGERDCGLGRRVEGMAGFSKTGTQRSEGVQGPRAGD